LPSEKPARRLEDIIENAQAIQRYVAGMDGTAFGKDQKTIRVHPCSSVAQVFSRLERHKSSQE